MGHSSSYINTRQKDEDTSLYCCSEYSDHHEWEREKEGNKTLNSLLPKGIIYAQIIREMEEVSRDNIDEILSRINPFWEGGNDQNIIECELQFEHMYAGIGIKKISQNKFQLTLLFDPSRNFVYENQSTFCNTIYFYLKIMSNLRKLGSKPNNITVTLPENLPEPL